MTTEKNMAQVSPGSEVIEIDASVTTARVGNSAAVFVGDFVQGPVDEKTQIGSTNDYVTVFGEPNAMIMNQWYQGYNFLSYGAGFSYVTRVVGPTALNSTAEIEAAGGSAITATAQLIKNKDDWDIISMGGIVFGEDESGEIRTSVESLSLTFDNTDPANPTISNATGASVDLEDAVLYTATDTVS